MVPRLVPDALDVVALADDRLALAVIAEAAGLDDGGQADAFDRGAQGFRRRHIGIVGGADAEPTTKSFSIRRSCVVSRIL